MKRLFMFIEVLVVIATGSCKKEVVRPTVKTVSTQQAAKPAPVVVQARYNYHEAIMAKHTVNTVK